MVLGTCHSYLDLGLIVEQGGPGSSFGCRSLGLDGTGYLLGPLGPFGCYALGGRLCSALLYPKCNATFMRQSRSGGFCLCPLYPAMETFFYLIADFHGGFKVSLTSPGKGGKGEGAGREEGWRVPATAARTGAQAGRQGQRSKRRSPSAVSAKRAWHGTQDASEM